MPAESFSDDFAISTRNVAADVVVVAIAGDLDFETVPQAKEFLARATANGPQHLILDLTDVKFMASSGLALLITARASEDGIQGRLHLLGVIDNRAVERPLAAVALLDLFDIAPDLGTLLADLHIMHTCTD